MSREPCNNIATNLQRAIEWLGVRYEQILKHLPEDEAFFIAVNAIREKQEREKGCERCNGYTGEQWTYRDIDHDFMHYRSVFCPHCGRRLKEEIKDA